MFSWYSKYSWRIPIIRWNSQKAISCHCTFNRGQNQALFKVEWAYHRRIFPEILLLWCPQHHLSKGPKSPYESEGQTRPFTGQSVCSETQREITYRSNTQGGRTKLDSVQVLGLPEAQNEVPPRSQGRWGLARMIPAEENILYSIKWYTVHVPVIINNIAINKTFDSLVQFWLLDIQNTCCHILRQNSILLAAELFLTSTWSFYGGRILINTWS